jgi:molybdopterin-guanine dinucleotide biosynthesis protein A
VLERLGARKVFFEGPEAFANVNTPDDLSAVKVQRSRGR